MRTPRYWLRKWLGIETMQVHLDLLTPKDFGTPGFIDLKFRGMPIGRIAEEDAATVTQALIKGYEHKL